MRRASLVHIGGLEHDLNDTSWVWDAVIEMAAHDVRMPVQRFSLADVQAVGPDELDVLWDVSREVESALLGRGIGYVPALRLVKPADARQGSARIERGRSYGILRAG